MKKHWISIRLGLLMITVSFVPLCADEKKIMACEPKKVTVWVHGTRGISFLPLGIMPSALALEHAFCYSPPGLHAASTIDTSLYQRKNVALLAQVDGEQFPFEHSYLFGWSGKVNFDTRREAGKQLFDSLNALTKDYKERYGCAPLITIITHSHGGNVVLNMARDLPSDCLPFYVERAIFLGLPVQKETDRLAKHNLFKHIYLIHSHIDLFQRIDPQKIQALRFNIGKIWQNPSYVLFKKMFTEIWRVPILSQRHFADNKKIVQVQVTWSKKAPWTDRDFDLFVSFAPMMRTVITNMNKFVAKAFASKRGVSHLEMILPLFLERLPLLLKELESAKDYCPRTLENLVLDVKFCEGFSK